MYIGSAHECSVKADADNIIKPISEALKEQTHPFSNREKSLPKFELFNGTGDNKKSGPYIQAYCNDVCNFYSTKNPKGVDFARYPVEVYPYEECYWYAAEISARWNMLRNVKRNSWRMKLIDFIANFWNK